MLSSYTVSLLISFSLVLNQISAIPVMRIPEAEICRRTLTIADKAAEIGLNLAYVVCLLAEEGKAAAVALGLPGVVAQKCVAPGFSTSPVVSQPAVASTPVIVVHQPAAIAAAAIASLPVAAVISTPVAPISVSSNPLTAATPIEPSSSFTAAQLNTCTSTDPDVCFEQRLALDAHNIARRAHHVPDLVWNNDLAAASLRWANHCVWGHSEGVLFPSSYVYGENIYASTATEPTTNSTLAISAYTNEESIYDYNNPGFSEATGHFTQVVWKNTREVGCVIINCDLAAFHPSTNIASYQVCTYYPSGNYEGEFVENVLRP